MTDDNNDDYEPYNGAYMGYSPYDMSAEECGYGDYDPFGLDDDDDPFDCCDDAEDYGEELDNED